MVKNPPANAGDMGSISGSGRSPIEGNGTPIFLLGKSHGQRRLVGYSPWSLKTVRHNLATKQQLSRVWINVRSKLKTEEFGIVSIIC